MELSYTIRPARIEDALIIVRQRRRMFEDMGYSDYIQSEGVDAAYLEWVKPRLLDGRCRHWLVQYAGEIVGGGGIEIHERAPHPVGLATHYAHVVGVYIEPEHRRQGLARQLMLTALAFCRESGLNFVTLQASDFGRPLYESLGFEASSEMRLLMRDVHPLQERLPHEYPDD
ncbi:MAG: GNAT family N-acetyltransferase [Anaerolineae bacterium]|nr:GNAT family N-acetyltransferase [Anaerolineae bacterium]